MQITKSAKKALRQNEKRRVHNLGYKRKMRKLVKQVKGLVIEKKKEEAKKLLPQVYKILDKTAKAGIIKKNNASRNKSRLTKLCDK